MIIIPKTYIKTLQNRDFFVLCLVTIIGQIASAFLLISLIVSVYLKTGSNFGVSGVVISSVAPGFFLMAIAGLCADLFDRKKIIVVANTFLALVGFLIISSLDKIFFSISLSFLYFAINSFFMTAANGASGQLVKRRNILASNSIFVFCIAGGQIFGLMLAAIVHFFFGNLVTVFIFEILLCAAALLSLLLPKMLPRIRKDISIFGEIVQIWKALGYIFGRKKTWAFFFMLAFAQAVISFGVTLAPGFFRDILAIGVEKALILIFPLVGFGSVFGAIFVQSPKVREGYFLSIGLGAIGIPGLIIGILISTGLGFGAFLIFLVSLYIVLLGFGTIASIIAARTVLQKLIAHNYLGSVLGANTILTAFFAGFLSPFGAGFVALFGYEMVLILGGLVFSLGSFVLLFASNKWKF